MTIQSISQIGNVIRNAVAFNSRNWHGDVMNTDSLILSVQDLFTLLEKRAIDYVLVGGIAFLHYVEGRNTQDVDVIMALSALEQLPELFIHSQDKDFVRAAYGDLQIDILLTQNPLFQRVHHEFTGIQQFLDRSIPIATVEGLVLLKLYALPSLYRLGNFARVGIYENDVATLIQHYQPDMPSLTLELAKFVSEDDLVEIKTIITDLQHRIMRFRDASARYV